MFTSRTWINITDLHAFIDVETITHQPTQYTSNGSPDRNAFLIACVIYSHHRNGFTCLYQIAYLPYSIQHTSARRTQQAFTRVATNRTRYTCIRLSTPGKVDTSQIM